MARDTRPLLSVMPAHLEPIIDRRGAELTQLLIATFHDVMTSDPDRSKAELENDAFSMVGHFLAMGGAMLTALLADKKGTAIGIAHPVTLADVAARWAVLIAAMEAERELQAGATRQ